MHNIRIVAALLLSLTLVSCSSTRPPEELFQTDVERMVLTDRELGFAEEISDVRVIDRTAREGLVEVTIRVTGWATHPELTIGATLPAGRERRDSWATWKYFCRKRDKEWVIEEKFKVEEGRE
jgi:hypothetical protein